MLIPFDLLDTTPEPFPLWLQFAICCEVLARHGVSIRPVEMIVFRNMVAAAKRQAGKDEDQPLVERPPKTMADHRAHFENVVAWVKDEIAPDGRVYDRVTGKTLSKTRQLALHLADRNPMVGPEHVERAQDILWGRAA